MDPDVRGKTTFLFTLKILKHGVFFAHTATACSVRTAEAVRFKPHPRLAEGKQNEKSTHTGCFSVLCCTALIDATVGKSIKSRVF